MYYGRGDVRMPVPKDYAKLIKSYQDEIEQLKLHMQAKDDAYISLLKDYEELKKEREFFYKCAKQFRDDVDRWEKDFREGRIVEKD